MSEKRWGMWIATLWAWYAHVSGALVLVLGASLALVNAFAENGPVVESLSPVTLNTPRVPARGVLSFTIDTRRNESCDGMWVGTMVSKTNHGPPAVITITRPTAVRTRVPGLYLDSKVSIELPEAVFPGRWMFRAGVNSRCPTRERFDELATFEFEVVAPGKEG